MSASTVSVTANTAARRRPVLASEKKSGVEMLTAEGVAPRANDGSGEGNDKVAAANTKDLSHHSIRGEAVLERSSKDFVQVRKTIGNSTVSPRRTRKVLSRPEKPLWLTVLSILLKNLALAVAILGLVLMVRKLFFKSGDGSVAAEMGFTELEGRISEVEAFMKTTAKMIQVQVEVVDRKLENEIGGLRREVSKKIDEKVELLESGLKKLEVKGEGLERSLGDLRGVEWLSKGEFEQIYQDLKAKKGEYGDGATNLEEIKAYAREIVEKGIEKHAADGLGRLDYAIASAGGRVVKHSEPFFPGWTGNWFRARSANGVNEDADTMLRPSFGEPGQCFPLKGSSGFVHIRLRAEIIPEAITLEHIAKSVAYNRKSAPRDCRVFGWRQGTSPESTISPEKVFCLAEFSYDLEKSNAQTYDVLNTADIGVIDTIRFEYSSNHGSPDFTCIYRLRVHGHEPDSATMMPMPIEQ